MRQKSRYKKMGELGYLPIRRKDRDERVEKRDEERDEEQGRNKKKEQH